jgi:hypothetical protein
VPAMVTGMWRAPASKPSHARAAASPAGRHKAAGGRSSPWLVAHAAAASCKTSCGAALCSHGTGTR